MSLTPQEEKRLAELRAKKQTLLQGSVQSSDLAEAVQANVDRTQGTDTSMYNVLKTMNKDLGFEPLDDFSKGLMIGFNQEGQMQSAATSRGASLDNPNVQTGIKTAQLIKAGTEFAVADALTAGLGGPLLIAMKSSPKIASIVTKAAQAEKLVAKGSNSNQVIRTIGDFAKGATIAGGANAITNVGAAGVAALGDPQSFSGNVGETLGETGSQALIGGGLSAALGPMIRTGAKVAGSRQSKRDVAEELSMYANKMTATAERDTTKAVTKLYQARQAELEPIQKALDKVEAGLQKSNAKINVKDLPKELLKLMEDINNGKFKGAKSTKPIVTLKEIFDIPENATKTIGKIKDTAGSNLKVVVQPKDKFISLSDLAAVKNNISEILDNGFKSGAKADLQELAGYVKRANLEDKVINMMPQEYITQTNNYKKVLKKYGDPRDKEFSNLTTAYNIIKDGKALSKEAATKALKATTSKKSELVGSFVNQKLLEVDDVMAANISANSKNAKTFIAPELRGAKGDSLELLRAGIDPTDVHLLEGSRLGSSPIGQKVRTALGQGEVAPNAVTKEGSRLLDPLDVVAGMTRKEGNIQAALGVSPQSTELVGDINKLQFLQQQAVPGVKQAVSDAGLGTKLLQGFDAGSANPEAALKNMARLQLLNQLGPQAMRSALQSAGTTFFGTNQYGASGY